MALSPNVDDREYARFFETADGLTGVRTGAGYGLGKVGSWDAGAIAYPTTTQEIYTYYEGGLAGTLKGTLTINYVDSTKVDTLNFAWVYP